MTGDFPPADLRRMRRARLGVPLPTLASAYFLRRSRINPSCATDATSAPSRV